MNDVKTKSTISLDWCRRASDKDLEIFVRSRLGQKDPQLCEPQQDHMRLDFHSETWKRQASNLRVLAKFQDLFKFGDHSHAPLLYGYKGTIYLQHGFWSKRLCSFGGWGTVQILMWILRHVPEDGYPNACVGEGYHSFQITQL